MIKKIAAQILFLFFSAFLASLILFTLFEVYPTLPSKLGLNALNYYALNERYVTDKDLIFKMKPNFEYQGHFSGDIIGLKQSKKVPPPSYHAQYNAEGFRGKKVLKNPSIAVLGDSFIEFGLNEEDTFPAKLSQKMNKPVANYGLGWYGPHQYLSVFKKYVIEKKPSIVLFCFFEGNDFRDIREYLKWEKGNDYYHFNLTKKNFIERYFLSIESTLRFFAKLVFRRFDARKTVIHLNTKTYPTVFVYPPNTEPLQELKRSREAIALEKILEEFKKEADIHKIKVGFVFIPSKAHIYLAYTDKGTLERKKLAEEQEFLVKQITKKTGIPYFSLTPQFKELAKKGDLTFYMNDTHWNEKGREIAATAIHQFIKEKLV